MWEGIMLRLNTKKCELISLHKKVMILQKSRPKISPPFKCYIYCTKNDMNPHWHFDERFESETKWSDNIIGEFICDEIHCFESEFCEGSDCYEDIRLIYEDEDREEEDFKIITSNEMQEPSNCSVCKKCQMTFNEIKNYVGTGFKTFYGWDIYDLKIYDEPKKITDFVIPDNYRIEKCAARERIFNNPDFTNGAFLKGSYYCRKYDDFCDKCLSKDLVHAPTSWQYVKYKY